ncbi:MAG TPA: hypothetical protein VK633_13585 [Verrucomicrobiae bacterium]|nr:hypothetical protein [Verrucomicrobiae bacterium]
MNAVLGCKREIENYATSEVPRGLFLRIGVAVQERRCPFCESIIYSRRHKLCGVCGVELPKDCRFTEQQAQNVQTIVREEKQRHREWLQKFN